MILAIGADLAFSVAYSKSPARVTMRLDIASRKIERLVVDALRFQLSDPSLIREYVKAYREERNRAEGEARRKRPTLDRDYAKTKSEIQHIVSSIAKGLITEDEAASLLGSTRREITRLESELATADSTTNVIELHPQAVQRLKENVEALADILVTKEALPDLELIGTFRSLVERVIVSPRKAGEEYEVSIRGYLASLMGAEVSALSMVAGTATSQYYGTVILLPETRSVVH